MAEHPQPKRRKVLPGPGRWRRLRRWLGRRQRLARTAMWLVVGGYACLLLWVVGALVLRMLADRSAGDDENWSAQAPRGAGRVEPEYRRPDPSPEAAEEDDSRPAVTFEWRREDRLRRAAALLAREDDVRGAIGLLLQEPDTAAARDVAALVWQQVEAALPAALAVERQELLTYLRQTRPDAELPAGEAMVDALDDPLRFCLLQNVYRRLLETGRGLDAAVAVVLESRLPGDDLGRQLCFRARRHPHCPYPEHLAAFNRQLNADLVAPIAEAFLIEEQQRLSRAPAPIRQWYADVLGKEAAAALAAFDAKADGEALWRQLPEHYRAVWGGLLYLRFRERHGVELPAEAIADNLWLHQPNPPLPGKTVLTDLRAHPTWRLRLRGFEWKRAVDHIGDLAAVLHLEAYVLPLRAQLAVPVSEEMGKLQGSRGDWRQLPDALGIAAGMPPLTDNERQAWRRLPETRVAAAMARLAARRDGNVAERMREIIRLYCLNRAVSVNGEMLLAPGDDAPLKAE